MIYWPPEISTREYTLTPLLRIKCGASALMTQALIVVLGSPIKRQPSHVKNGDDLDIISEYNISANTRKKTPKNLLTNEAGMAHSNRISCGS